jgi:hypothetical protein
MSYRVVTSSITPPRSGDPYCRTPMLHIINLRVEHIRFIRLLPSGLALT